MTVTRASCMSYRKFAGSRTPLTKAFPYWFHFCNKVDESLFVLIARLLPIDSSSRIGG